MSGMDGDHQESLTQVEVRDVVGILSEVAACPGDGRVRKSLLMNRVAELIGADRWIWVVSRYEPSGAVMALSFLQNGFSERDIALVMESASDTNTPLLEHEKLFALCQQGSHFTRLRHELVPDDAWYSSVQYSMYRAPMGVNEFLYSIRPLDGGLLSGVGFHREAGRPAFTQRQSLLVHIIFTSAAALHTMDLPEANGADILDLPPRVRTTFGLLVEGFPRQKIATFLGVSPYTVAEYSSRVYKHFAVTGQRELMRRFRTGDGRHREPDSINP